MEHWKRILGLCCFAAGLAYSQAAAVGGHRSRRIPRQRPRYGAAYYTRPVGLSRGLSFDNDAGQTTLAYFKVNEDQYLELSPKPQGGREHSIYSRRLRDCRHRGRARLVGSAGTQTSARSERPRRQPGVFAARFRTTSASSLSSIWKDPCTATRAASFWTIAASRIIYSQYRCIGTEG